MDLESTQALENNHESADLIIDRFEQVVRSGDADELLNHVPPETHPDRLNILCELIRIDLENCFEKNRDKELAWYESQFPYLFKIPSYRELIIFELRRLQAAKPPTESMGIKVHSLLPSTVSGTSSDRLDSVFVDELMTYQEINKPDDAFRKAARVYQELRRQALNDEQPVDLAAHLGNDVSAIPTLQTFCETCATNPKLADKIASATLSMPEPGDKFLQFKLERLLGSGSFGRVFLARQGDLANRLVALKITADVGGEAKHLAQLQHTNIIPIYSVHRVQNLRAVCMPYFGSATLADLVSQIKGKDSIPNTWADFVSSFYLRQKTSQNGTPLNQLKTPEQEDITKTLRDTSIELSPAKPEVQTPLLQTQPGNEIVPVVSEFSLFHKAFDSSNLKNLDYVSAILWVMKRIADGLAHAHDRGIIHRDLKPANILFSDDGEPLLLDFNIAADTKESGFHQIGGTLPYMSPEHLMSLQEDNLVVETSCDIYSVGVIFYELLTGSLPFPSHYGSMHEIIPLMVADRQNSPKTPAHYNNPHVSPAINAIVERCLHPNPLLRYHSAYELTEDIDRQLHNLPLRFTQEPSYRERIKKWSRRNPVLTSNSFIISACLMLLLAGLFAYLKHDQNYRIGKANLLYRNVQDQWPKIVSGLLGQKQLRQERDESLALCLKTIEPYLTEIGDENWTEQNLVQILEPNQRTELVRNLSELMYFMAKSEAEDSLTSKDQATRLMKLDSAESYLKKARTGFANKSEPASFSRLDQKISDIRNNRELSRAIISAPPLASSAGFQNNLDMTGARDRILDLADSEQGVKDSNFLATLTLMNEQSSTNPYTWTLLGNAFASNGQIQKAIDDYGHAIALDKDVVWPRLHRGILFLEKFDYQSALRDFNQVVLKRPDLSHGWLNRAIARMGLADFQGALDDLDQISELQDTPTRVGFIRARCLDQLGRIEEALKTREETLRKRPNEEASWVSRGLEFLKKDPNAALADFEEALKINRSSIVALQNKAYVQSERLNQPENAISTLSELLVHHPRFVPAITGRGVLYARTGDTDAALKDANSALLFDNSPNTTYQVACIYALLSKKNPELTTKAVKLLGQALRVDQKLLRVAQTDSDIEPIRSSQLYKALVDATQKLENLDLK